MQQSSIAKFSGVFFLLLLANFSGLYAQEVSFTEESLSREIAANWKSFQIQTKTLTPEERIAAVDKWQKTPQPKLEALKQKRIQSARQASAQTAPGSMSSLAPVTELDQINAAIKKEFQPILAAKLSPEERIRQVDAAIEKSSALQAQRAGILRETAASANAATPLFTRSILPEQNTPEGRLAAKSRKILEQTKNLTPEERIAAIDARKDEIEALSREAWAARKTAAAAFSNQPIPSK